MEPIANQGCEDVSIRLAVKVVPSSSRTAIAGWLGDALKIRVTSAAEDGKANAAVEAALAEALGIPRESARIVRGRSSPRKIVEVVGLSGPELHRRLSRGSAFQGTDRGEGRDPPRRGSTRDPGTA
jgi:hypothetical protein